MVETGEVKGLLVCILSLSTLLTGVMTFQAVLAVATDAPLDLYTETRRWYGYVTPYVGEGLNAPADAYAADEDVTLYALLNWDGHPLQGHVLVFEVRDPRGDLVLNETATTNETGVATVSFGISAVCPEPFGKWWCLAEAEVEEAWINDTLMFDVGWIVELLNVVPYGYRGGRWQPVTQFRKGEHVGFMVTLRNIALTPRNVTIYISVYDVCDFPVGSTFLETVMPAGEWCAPMEAEILITCLEIPRWALTGSATGHVSAYTALPSECGVPYCPEIVVTFDIVTAHEVTVTEITPSATEAYPTWVRPLEINVTVKNTGDFTETFTVTAYYGDATDTAPIGAQNVGDLAPGAGTTITFTWNLTGAPPCRYRFIKNSSDPQWPGYYIPYNLSVNVSSSVLGQDDWYDGAVTVRLPGDASGDGWATGTDLAILGRAWYKFYPDPRYDWRADWSGDGQCTGGDLGILARNWYQSAQPA